ncbi:hypothetical protein CBL_00879 [Carabus blaptoides fortunei]
MLSVDLISNQLQRIDELCCCVHEPDRSEVSDKYVLLHPGWPLKPDNPSTIETERKCEWERQITEMKHKAKGAESCVVYPKRHQYSTAQLTRNLGSHILPEKHFVHSYKTDVLASLIYCVLVVPTVLLTEIRASQM